MCSDKGEHSKGTSEVQLHAGQGSYCPSFVQVKLESSRLPELPTFEDKVCFCHGGCQVPS